MGLQAQGGSGVYKWSCDHVDVVGVSAGGVATVVSTGEALITASDVKNLAHFDTAMVALL